MDKRQERIAELNELTATARIDLTSGYDVRYLKTVHGQAVNDSLLPWKWYKEIGEIHYGISRGARTAGYATLQARKLNTDGTIGKVITGGTAGEVAAMLSSPYGGQRAFTERFFTLRKVPGDAYLIRCREKPDGTGEVVGYQWLSARELDPANSLSGTQVDNGETVFAPNQTMRWITHPRANSGEQLVRYVQAEDFLGRVWRPGNEFVDQSDSPLAALRMECELLHLLTQSLKAKLRSRFAINGIFYIPSQINEVKQGAPVGKDNEVVHENKVLDALIKAATFTLLNFDDPLSALPIFMTGPGEWADAIKHIVMDREIFETDMRLRQELLDKILMGLDVQPQNVRGLGEANHWSSWAVEDDERRINIQPEMEAMCWALTRLVLHAEMKAKGQPAGKILSTILWYDLTKANVKTNLAEDGRQAFDRWLIGPPGVRRLMGIDEADKPTDLELIRMFGNINKNAYLAFYQMDESLIGGIDWEKAMPSKTGPAPDSAGDKPESGPGQDTGSPNKSPGGKKMASLTSIA